MTAKRHLALSNIDPVFFTELFCPAPGFWRASDEGYLSNIEVDFNAMTVQRHPALSNIETNF